MNELIGERAYSARRREVTVDVPFDQITGALESLLGIMDPTILGGTAPTTPEAARAHLEACEGLSGFALFQKIDHGRALAILGKGAARAITFVFGNALIAVEMTRHSPLAGLYVPLRLMVHELAPERTLVTYDLPSATLGQFGSGKIDAVAASLDDKVARLVHDAATRAAAGVAGSPVEEHYGLGDLREGVNAALRQAHLGDKALDWSTLAPLDHFHVRGLQATQELAAGLDLSPDSTLLDVGCGLGGPARYLAATTGCRVTGIDLSRPFVEVATMLTERAGLSGRVSFRQADALALPFEDATFDRAWTQHVAMNIQDRARFYESIHRVLKPGGLLAIYDIIAGEKGPVLFPVPWARRSEMSFLVDAADMRRALSRAGFTEVSWEDKTESGREWFAAQRAGSSGSAGPPALGIHVVMGPEFSSMAANVGRNLEEGRIRLVQTIVRRPAV